MSTLFMEERKSCFYPILVPRNSEVARVFPTYQHLAMVPNLSPQSAWIKTNFHLASLLFPFDSAIHTRASWPTRGSCPKSTHHNGEAAMP
ncbi:hypothetical protein TIFTF001_024893 [Ficus carica]|uniref:Uncharacterized protein n=1 Tax=Ficus carica TaxID=3494 RepID=A0AA88DKG4_FICCA|nr:hypothetical protein TIFTF001_024893 [Ficus carica]